MDRYEIAWRIWCWQEGYGKAEDREGLENHFRKDDNELTENDRQDKETLLSVADDILASLPGHKKPMVNSGIIINVSEPEPRIIPVVVRDPRMRS